MEFYVGSLYCNEVLSLSSFAIILQRKRDIYFNCVLAVLWLPVSFPSGALDWLATFKDSRVKNCINNAGNKIC